MTVPTRIIDKEEFEELMKQEGDIIPVFHLTNIEFDPPTSDGPKPQAPKRDMHVLLLNVAEPCIYKDVENNIAFVIMNAYNSEESFTYENFQDCHIDKGAWCYRLSPNYWDETDFSDDLTSAIYRFNHGDIPTWEKPGD